MILDEKAGAEDREKGGCGADGAAKEMKKKWARGKKVMP